MIGRRPHDDAQAFDDAWSGRAPRDEQIAELVRFAEGLCESAVTQPTPAFRTNLRAQLMTEAATVLVAQPPTRTTAAPRTARPVRRRLAAVTAALVASAGVVGIVASSASAVPGEMLYPVKRGVENVELALHRDDASRGSFQLAQASERLAEARQLSDDGRPESLITDTLDDFASQASAGSSRLFSDFTDSGEETSIRKVNAFAAAASVDLADLSKQLPAGADEAFAAATEAVGVLATEATSLCSSCTPADVQSLVSAVTDLARKTPAETSPTEDTGSRSGSDDKPSTEKPSSKGSDDRSPTTAPSAGPTSAAPVIPTPTKTPSLDDVTDPLIGGLLGDDEQDGLVPGLLDGLLGGQSTPPAP